MKNFNYALCAFLLLFVACSKDEDNNKTENTPPKVEMTFDINVSNVTGIRANISITPDNKEESYFYWVMPLEQYQTKFGGDDSAVVAYDISYWQEFASISQGASWLDLMNEDLVLGDTLVDTDNEQHVLMWGTEYIVYAYGLNQEGEQTTKVQTQTFKTQSPENHNTTFEVEISATEWDSSYNKYAVDATITPSNNDTRYFVTITNMDWYEWYFTDNNKGRSDETYIIQQILLNVGKPSAEILSDYTTTGVSVYKPYEVRNQYLNPSKRYGVFVFGISTNGATTPLTVHEFTTPERPE